MNRSLLVRAVAVWGFLHGGTALAQVDLSCVGVQVMSAHAKMRSLPAEVASAHRPAMDRIHGLARDAASEVKGPEERWNTARREEEARVRAANPGASREEMGRLMQQRLLQSPGLDRNFAALLVAQERAHKFEEEIIRQSRQIPGRDNAREVSELSQRFAQTQGAARANLERIQRSPTLQHLVSTLAASQHAARSSTDLPAAGLSRPGFDTPPAEVRIAGAARAASILVAESDSRSTGGQLILNHLGSLMGGRESRAELMRDRSKETARVASQQLAKALNETHKSGVAMDMLSKNVRLDRIHVPSPEPSTPSQPGRSWGDALADKVTDTVSTIYEVVYGLPGGPPQERK